MLTSLVLLSAGLDRRSKIDDATPATLPRGQVLRQCCNGKSEQTYYLYIPRSGGNHAPLMVSIHGVSRNAHKHAHLLAPLAERYGVVLIAPLFTKTMFPDYQRLGRVGRGPRADHALDQVVGDALLKTGADTRRMYLCGYSGGGQCAHRYAMAHPERVAGVVVGAAGWYTFPDNAIRFPRGIIASKSLPGVHFDPERFLRVPMTIIVGSMDIARDTELNQSLRIDKQQGENRLVRAENWIRAMNYAAHARGLHTRYRLEIMPGVGHSFGQGVRSGELGERIFQNLFAKPLAGKHKDLSQMNTTEILAEQINFAVSTGSANSTPAVQTNLSG